MASEKEIRELAARILDQLEPPAPPAAMPNPAGPPPAAVEGAARRLALGADHGGFALKQRLVEHLRGRGFEVEDCGTTSGDPVDYPDFAHAVALRVADGRCAAGIVVDGAGIGSCMVANKVPGVRASLCYDLSSARNSREHNHANVLTLGAVLIGAGLAIEIVDAWLATPWGPDRHARRVEKIMAVERQYLKRPGEPPEAPEAPEGG